MSAINPLISNGTCYYGINQRASSNIIPCGNAASGTQQCCQQGDYCLEFGVCYNTKYGTTYLAGCTGADFTSPNCPVKKGSQQQLLNLVQCADTESDSSVVWSACSGPTTRTEMGPPAACTCTDSDNGIFTGPTRFDQVASLPTATGRTISFAPGHTPRTKGSATVTSTDSDGEATATNTLAISVTSSASDGQLPTATNTFAVSPTTAPSTAGGDTGLSKGTKAGIGVGVAAFAAGILALVAFFFVRYRRRQSKKGPGADAAYQPATPDPGMGQSPPPQYGSSMGKPGIPYDPSPPPHDASVAGYPGYTGFKSELPAVPIERSKPPYTSELPAGDGAVSTGRGLDRNATPSLLSMPGSVGHLSMVSDISRPSSVSPPTQFSQGDGHMRSPASGNMTPIAELNG